MRRACKLTSLTISVVVAAAGVLLSAGPAAAIIDVAGWHFSDLSAPQIPITFRLAFDDQRIAWAKGDGVQSDVFVADVATGVTTRITQTPESEESIALDGDRLVWLARPTLDFAVPAEVKLYDLDTHETRVLGSGRVGSEAGPQIVGDHVAWALYEQGAGGLGGARLTLFAYTISTGALVQVSDELSSSGGGDSASFGLGDTHLAFVKEAAPGQDAEVWMYDVADASLTKLGISAADSRHVSVEGDVVAWAAPAEPGRGASYRRYDIVAHAVSGGDTRVVATREGPEPYPKTDGRFVVWDTYDGSLRTIEAYDLQTDKLIDVSHNLFLNFTPEVSDGLVVWERGGELDSEIMAHDLLTGQTTQLSSNRVWMDQASQVHGRTVVWWKHWFTNEPGPEPPEQFVVAQAPVSHADPFGDVDGVHRYRTAILGADEQGIVGGYLVGDRRLFRPEAPLLRAQFAKMVAEAFDVPVTEDMANGFYDLGPDDPESLYPHEYVAALSPGGILRGVGGGRFDPYAPLTRAQAATVLVRALDQLYPGLLTNAQGQAPGAYFWEPPHLDNLRRAYANDLLAGTVDWMRRWDARILCSRGEAVQLIWSALSLVD